MEKQNQFRVKGNTAKNIPVSGSDAYNNIYGDFLGKLTEPKKTVSDSRSVITYNDCDLGDLVVFYRVADVCDNAQTDNSSDGYVIDCVKLEDEEIKFSGKLEEEILSYLNCQNPKGLKFPDVNSHTPNRSVPDWWLDNYTDASGNCYSDADEGL